MAAFDLDESLGFLLSRAAGGMKRALEERLEKYDVTAPQWAVLARLWQENGQSPSTIAERLRSDRPTVTGIVERLEQKGLVRRTSDPDDGRMLRIVLTRRGRDLERLLPALAGEVNRLASSGMQNSDVERLKRYLRQLTNNL